MEGRSMKGPNRSRTWARKRVTKSSFVIVTLSRSPVSMRWSVIARKYGSDMIGCCWRLTQNSVAAGSPPRWRAIVIPRLTRRFMYSSDVSFPSCWYARTSSCQLCSSRSSARMRHKSEDFMVLNRAVAMIAQSSCNGNVTRYEIKVNLITMSSPYPSSQGLLTSSWKNPSIRCWFPVDKRPWTL